MNYSQEILEVHAEFNTAAEKLLEEAKQYLDNTPVPSPDKYQMLKEFGFTGTEEYRANHIIASERSVAKIVAETVTYYSKNYHHKFIQEGDVRHICSKYGLICGSTQLYKGFVPEKNLQEILNFKLPKEQDQAYVYQQSSWSENFGYIDIDRYLSLSNAEKERARPIGKQDLLICAPQDDFDMKNHEVKDNKLVKKVPDPVVLCPVRLGYLIITAWGDEASDPLVLNEKNN